MNKFKYDAKEEYLTALRAIGDNWRADYDKKNVEVAIRLTDGTFLTIDKPRIQTRFCYGYGMYLQSTEEQEEAATSCSIAVENNEDVFIDENMRMWNDNHCIEKLDSNIPHIVMAIKDKTRSYPAIYRGCGEEFVEKDGKLVDCYAPGYQYDRILTDEEKAMYLEALKYTKESFIKRLRTYLKRYGLSKVESWTYLVD